MLLGCVPSSNPGSDPRTAAAAQKNRIDAPSQSVGIGFASHSVPGVRGTVTFRGIRIRDTPAAGILVLGKPGVKAEWSPEFEDVRLENCAHVWPRLPAPTAKHKHPNSKSHHHDHRVLFGQPLQ